ncbi:ATP-binding protein [uncultured Microbulbifer sp.]|uniref:ATP-binding protein n=1 Tax=uncultured Microbulbifer sp. TaxID=348147 RepID=UPI002613A58E|nr:ATP-binding protein [uncultured Microbulbifer sp.]
MAGCNALPFVATGDVKQIFNLLDNLRVGYIEEGDTNCLITGESGSGKSELVKQYAAKYPRRELEEYTHIPVLYVQLSSPQTAKAFTQQVLAAMGDPQGGKGIKTKEEGFERIKTYCRICGVELIILDEIQTVIQNRSPGVIASITDWFKDLMNHSKVPVVLVGMPWCLDVVKENDQLDTRVGYRYYLETFRVSRQFSHFIKFIELFSKSYEFANGFSLSEPETAYRLFAYSSGIIRAIRGQIIRAANLAKSAGKPIDLACFLEAIRSRGIKDQNNVFIMPVTELRLREIVSSSRWTQQKSYNKESFQSAEFKTYRLTKKLELIEADDD